MNLVQSALRRSLTVQVPIVNVGLAPMLALRRMPSDISPTLGIPTIYVAQQYGGMDSAVQREVDAAGIMTLSTAIGHPSDLSAKAVFAW